MPSRPASRRRAVVASFAAAALLAACGGGIWIDVTDGWDDQDPSVSLAASTDTVQAGQSVRFVAAASDENGIDDVAFFRRDGSAWIRLGSDGSSPYEWNVTAPTDGRTTLQVFARARDWSGREADSQVVTVDITP